MSSAESPEKDGVQLTEEEQAQLEELKAKEAEVKALEAAKKADEDAKAKAEELERIANRPLYHVLVRHMARSPRTRTMRAARAGHRRQGVLLDDGTRIRKKGRKRYTEVDLRELARNNQRFLEFVRVGAIEVCDPKTEHAIPYNDLVKMIGDVAQWVAEKEFSEAMERWNAAHKAWKEACEAEEAAAEEQERDPVLPPEPEKPKKSKAVEVDESGLQQDPVAGSEREDNSAPPPPKGKSTEVTREDVDVSAVTAAVDQANAEKTGEANPPPSETGAGEADTGLLDDEGNDASEDGEEGHTEEELLAMKLDDLKVVAVETYGVDEETIKPMRAKKDVVAAIFAQGEGEE